MPRRCILIFILGMLLSDSLHAQDPALLQSGDRVDSALARYAASFEQSKLYLHLDKNIYTNNETVWFSAYVLGRGRDSFDHQVLYVNLLRNSDDSVVRSATFLIEGSHSYGNMILPHTVRPGTYRLMAFTNKLVNGFPSVIGQQVISIKTEEAPLFAVKISMSDPGSKPADSTTLVLDAVNAKGNPLRAAECSYEIRTAQKKVHKGKGVLDYKGNLVIAFSPGINAPLQFRATLSAEGEKEKIDLLVPPAKRTISLSFFPESGSIIGNTRARVAVEARTAFGEPLTGTIRLYEGGRHLADFALDRKGYGLLLFYAAANAAYTATVEHEDSTWRFSLPLVRGEGYSVQIKDAITSDSLRLEVQRDKAGIDVRFLIHNFRAVHLVGSLNSQRDALKAVCSIGDLPEGLYAFTLTDLANRPLCERLFYVSRNSTGRVRLQTSTLR